MLKLFKTSTRLPTKMSAPLVTYDDALQSLGNVPNLGDRLTATIICNLQEELCNKLEAIPSHQSNDFGF